MNLNHKRSKGTRVKRILIGLVICLWAAPALAQSNLLPTIQRFRAEYPTPMARWQVAELLNRVAWAHRAEGWGLLKKDGGSRCPAPHGFDISCDILIHSPTILHFDVLTDSDGAAIPTWQNVGPCVLSPTSGCDMSQFRAPIRPAQLSTTRGDFDGDAHSDMSVFRPSDGTWWIWQSTGAGPLTRGFGIQGDVPLTGDIDGDGKSELAVYRPSNGVWYALLSSSGYTTSVSRQWGIAEDIPVVADFNGDTVPDLTVFRPSTGTWWIWYSSPSGFVPGNWTAIEWGAPGDVPLATDFDGDGRADLVVFRPSTGQWYISFSFYNFNPAVAATVGFGVLSDVPLIGDFDGDRAPDLAVFRPSNGYWYIWYSQGGFLRGPSVSIGWGVSGDQPVVGDFDGDGRTDIAVWRPSTGWWFLLYSSYGFGGGSSHPWGVPGDIPPLRP